MTSQNTEVDKAVKVRHHRHQEPTLAAKVQETQRRNGTTQAKSGHRNALHLQRPVTKALARTKASEEQLHFDQATEHNK